MAGDSITGRIFLALPLSDAFSCAITPLLNEAKRGSEGIKWVDPAQIHLTLHFFGPVSPEELVKTADCIDPVTRSSAPLELALGKVGYFPGPEQPRVIWVGLTGATNQLCALREKIEENLRGAGFVCETRPFHPHVTLGRARQGSKIRIPKGSFSGLPSAAETPRRIDRIILYRSELTPKVPHYEILKTFLLAQSPHA